MSVHLPVAGQMINDADVLVARYCGLTGEQWAYGYYDQIPLQDDGPTKVDLLTCATMHGGFRRTELEWFAAATQPMSKLLRALPADMDLADAPPRLLDTLVEGISRLCAAGPPSARSLASKILHRRRPRLVPIDERDIARRYGAALRGGGRLDYTTLVHAVAADLSDPTVAVALSEIRAMLADRGLVVVPSPLRTLDIAVWMDERNGT